MKLFTHLQTLWMYSDAVMRKITQNLPVWFAFRNPISALAPAVSACLNFHVRKCNRGVTRSEGLVNALKSVLKVFYRYFKGLLQRGLCLLSLDLIISRRPDRPKSPRMHHGSHALATLQSAWHADHEFHTSGSYYRQETWRNDK